MDMGNRHCSEGELNGEEEEREGGGRVEDQNYMVVEERGVGRRVGGLPHRGAGMINTVIIITKWRTLYCQKNHQ